MLQDRRVAWTIHGCGQGIIITHNDCLSQRNVEGLIAVADSLSFESGRFARSQVPRASLRWKVFSHTPSKHFYSHRRLARELSASRSRTVSSCDLPPKKRCCITFSVPPYVSKLALATAPKKTFSARPNLDLPPASRFLTPPPLHRSK